MQLQPFAGIVMAAFLLNSAAMAQSKIEDPEDTTRPSETTAEQVRACLLIAREISDITDRADAAKSTGDVDAFNATVDPYNSATERWNAGCTRPYNPADMIRAENELGLRLCQFTQTPCMAETERRSILIEEKKLHRKE
jgi:hypothetical protein